MIDSNALRGVIASKGMSQAGVAKAIDMAPKTFYTKMKEGVFGSDEIEKMIVLLDIADPMSIFFADFVTR